MLFSILLSEADRISGHASRHLSHDSNLQEFRVWGFTVRVRLQHDIHSPIADRAADDLQAGARDGYAGVGFLLLYGGLLAVGWLWCLSGRVGGLQRGLVVMSAGAVEVE